MSRRGTKPSKSLGLLAGEWEVPAQETEIEADEEQGADGEPEDDSYRGGEEPPEADERLPRRPSLHNASFLCTKGMHKPYFLFLQFSYM